jgi:hypothetical protein
MPIFPCSSWNWRCPFGSSQLVQGDLVLSLHVVLGLVLGPSQPNHELSLEHFSLNYIIWGSQELMVASTLYPPTPAVGTW